MDRIVKVKMDADTFVCIVEEDIGESEMDERV